MILGPLVPAQRLFGDGKTEEAAKEFEGQITAAGFEKGDDKVDSGRLTRLQSVSAELTETSKAPKGLAEAVDYLLNVKGE